MSLVETKYAFKARYGSEPSPLPAREATREEIDSFVREVLGLDERKQR